MSEREPNKGHRTLRPAAVRGLWRGFGLLLGLAVAAQLFIEVRGHFGADGWLGFNALYGFGACVVMVLFARALGVLVKRPEKYYRGDDA